MDSPQLDPARLRTAVADWAKASGKRLRTRRGALKLSQGQLADLVGIRSTAISKFELGLAIPKESVRIAITFALACEVADIWPALDREYVWAVARPVAA